MSTTNTTGKLGNAAKLPSASHIKYRSAGNQTAEHHQRSRSAPQRSLRTPNHQYRDSAQKWEQRALPSRICRAQADRLGEVRRSPEIERFTHQRKTQR